VPDIRFTHEEIYMISKLNGKWKMEAFYKLLSQVVPKEGNVNLEC